MEIVTQKLFTSLRHVERVLPDGMDQLNGHPDHLESVCVTRAIVVLDDHMQSAEAVKRWNAKHYKIFPIERNPKSEYYGYVITSAGVIAYGVAR